VRDLRVNGLKEGRSQKGNLDAHTSSNELVSKIGMERNISLFLDMDFGPLRATYFFGALGVFREL
jgi:hypothetical protein